MKCIYGFIFGMLLSLQVNAYQMGAVLGYRLNDASAVSSGVSVDGNGAFQVGALAYIPILGKIELRTGVLYVQRYFEVKSGASTNDAKLAYAELPITAMYRFMEYGGLFAGVNLGLKIADDCGGVDCSGLKSSVLPITFGAHFMAAPQVAVEVFYEMVSSNLYDELKDASALGVNAIVTFE
jgi:hypothetical protein